MPGVRAAKDGWIEVVATSPATIVVIMVLRIAISLFARGGLKPLDDLNDDQVDRAGDQKRHGEIEAFHSLSSVGSIYRPLVDRGVDQIQAGGQVVGVAEQQPPAYLAKFHLVLLDPLIAGAQFGRPHG